MASRLGSSGIPARGQQTFMTAQANEDSPQKKNTLYNKKTVTQDR